MGLKIQHLQGEVQSVSKKSVVLIAERESSFGIPEIDHNDVLDGSIEWVLMSQNKKDIAATIVKKMDENYTITIDKLCSGSYSYYLKAHYVSIKRKNKKMSTDSVCISGFCPPRILSFSSSVAGELTPGEKIKVDATLEGVNSNDLVLEVYSKNGDKEKKVHSMKEKCIEGKISFVIEGSKTLKWKPKPKESEVQILIKLFDKSNKKYINHA